MTQVLTPAAFAAPDRGTSRSAPRRPARLSFRLAPAGVPLLAALLSCGITLVSFTAVDSCAASDAPSAAYAVSASA